MPLPAKKSRSKSSPARCSAIKPCAGLPASCENGSMAPGSGRAWIGKTIPEAGWAAQRSRCLRCRRKGKSPLLRPCTMSCSPPGAPSIRNRYLHRPSTLIYVRLPHRIWRRSLAEPALASPAKERRCTQRKQRQGPTSSRYLAQAAHTHRCYMTVTHSRRLHSCHIAVTSLSGIACHTSS